MNFPELYADAFMKKGHDAMSWDHDTIKNTKGSVIGNFSKCRYPGFDEMVVKFMKDQKTDYQLIYDRGWNPISVSIK